MPTDAEALAENFGSGYDAEEVQEKLDDTAPVKLYSGADDTLDAGFQLGEDLAKGDLEALVADGTEAFSTASSFVNEAASTIGDIVSDPLGWLISNGVGFLVSWIKPLEDALELVTGDPDALEDGAKAFNQLGEQIEALKQETEELLASGLANWQGDGAEAAAKRLSEFRDGLSGTAGATTELATLLAVSSAVMSIAKDLVLSIISDFVEWLIVTWLAALAATVVTLGGSEAAAAAATGVRAATETSKVSRWMQKLTTVIDKIKSLIDKIKAFLEKIPGFKKLADAVGNAGDSLSPEKVTDKVAQQLTDGVLKENLGKEAADGILDRAKQAGRDAIENGETPNLTRDLRGAISDTIGEQAGGKLKEFAGEAVKDQVISMQERPGSEEVPGSERKIPDVPGTIDKAQQTFDDFTEKAGQAEDHGDTGMSDAEISGKLDF
ncbi:WXG100 family type VII secretion target [Amycolatopsis thermalba]|uniref:WXG100 family type VII secretion target n=1 Tax=Amycolatopsis thermalba TaxID=944492 RepID=A0ABY4NQS6_9PSEU|nr:MULTISPECIES: WXG100 family type VII secretion target [Amycolatopsis]UQS22358.1 WXG100 family type VII secretion target [Amycolatopsis thermalba]